MVPLGSRGETWWVRKVAEGVLQRWKYPKEQDVSKHATRHGNREREGTAHNVSVIWARRLGPGWCV